MFECMYFYSSQILVLTSTFLSPWPLQVVLKINAIFEARRGKKRMKKVSQSTEYSSGRGVAFKLECKFHVKYIFGAIRLTLELNHS